jgi:hypothetical protein
LKATYRYSVLKKAREIAESPDLDFLETRKYLGIPLAADIRRWLQEQPQFQLLCVDFSGVRGVSLSVAEELGPLVMKDFEQAPSLEHRYPIYRMSCPEPAYTFARAFVAFNSAGLGLVDSPAESMAFAFPVAQWGSDDVIVLGQLSKQMEEILRFIDRKADGGKQVKSDDLKKLDFLADVSAAARSKRMTELYTRRLVAFRDNPRNPKERLFFPPWRL